ncbi:MAG: hypothetical protein NW241_23050 [Bacteroidia bacterium]|nr:hypothetical protein [Bacteroidia bacterium]
MAARSGIRLRTLVLLLLAWSAVLPGCRSQEYAQSDLFYEVFRDDSSTFRGLYLGEPVETAVAREPAASLRYQDRLGASYVVQLSEGSLLLLDYYANYLKDPANPSGLASIVANILMEDEVETARLYSELVAHFNQRYGVASGRYGAYSWESPGKLTPDMEIILRLHEDKKGITVNFVDAGSGDPAGD